MIMMKKNPALLDIYHASIRLDSVFFHDWTHDKRRWSSTLPNSVILTCDAAVLSSTYMHVTVTSV
jgi:hypothetical protein